MSTHFIIGYRLVVPCSDGTITTATRMDDSERLRARFDHEVEELVASGHPVISVEWDTVAGGVEFEHFVLVRDEDAPHRSKIWYLCGGDTL